MTLIELLEHITANIKADKPIAHGLLFLGTPSRAISLDTLLVCHDPSRYTLAPPTHEVNGFTVPAPMTGPPAMGAKYFIAAPLKDEYFYYAIWGGYEVDLKYLNRGLAHSTGEAAQQNAKAMVKVQPNTTELE